MYFDIYSAIIFTYIHYSLGPNIVICERFSEFN